ncbi:MAG: hypothetical protein H8E15_02760 [Planctomycetes bacterium]|nr:hypothetical protein [Planctomycetota bacterium]
MIHVWRIRFGALAMALALYIVRTFVDETYATINWLAGFETMCWMLAILGFTSLYLNKPSRALSYLNMAVFWSKCAINERMSQIG